MAVAIDFETHEELKRQLTQAEAEGESMMAEIERLRRRRGEMTKDDEILQAAWEQLTILILRTGFGRLWMEHFIANEFDKLCADPVMRAKIGVEPPQCHNHTPHRAA